MSGDRLEVGVGLFTLGWVSTSGSTGLAGRPASVASLEDQKSDVEEDAEEQKRVNRRDGKIL